MIGNGDRVKKLQSQIIKVHGELRREQKRSLAHVSVYSKRQRLSGVLFAPFASLSEIQVGAILDEWIHVEERSADEVLTVLAALIALDRAIKAAEILDAVEDRVRGQTVTSTGYPDRKTVWWAHVIIDRIAPLAKTNWPLYQETKTLERYVNSLLAERAS